MTVIAVCGLAAEARIARGIGLQALAAGGDAALTVAKLDRAIAAGAEGIVSFGICGGLDPALMPGALLLPEAVLSGEGARFPVDVAWREAVAASLRRAALAPQTGDILGLAAILATAAEKSSRFRSTFARAIDMESGHAARAAQAAGLPFLVLRVVADPAQRSLPPAALDAADGEGRPKLARVLRALAADPRQLPAMISLAREARLALAMLARAASAAAPALDAPRS